MLIDAVKSHEALPQDGHAFNCQGIYREAWKEALHDGATIAEAARVARTKHDRAVQWIKDNVGLD